MRLAVIDVETTYLRHSEIPQTLFWGLEIEGEGYKRFESTADLWRFLESSEPLKLLHHHDFDPIQALVDGVEDIQIQIFRSGRIIKSRSHKKHTWINSMALFPSSLAKILSAAGFTKKPLGCVAHSDNPDARACTSCRTALEERNYSDCADALLAFRAIDAQLIKVTSGYSILEGKHATLAGYALNFAESVAGKVEIDLSDFARLAIRGGRCEAFRIGECGVVTNWDINSSYPFGMTLAPASDMLCLSRAKFDGWEYPPDWRLPICCVRAGRIEHPDCEMDKLLFPVGRFYTMGFSARHRAHCIESAEIDLTWLQRLAPAIRELYELRRESRNEPLRYAIKILLNSIYGKLAFTGDIETPRITKTLPPGDVLYHPLTHGRYLVSTFRKARKFRANYGMAAWILWNARERLSAELMTGDMYCDTDSIYRAGNDLPESNLLGGWKREKTGALFITGAKDYVFGENVKRKGGDSYKRWSLKGMANGVQEVHRSRLCGNCHHGIHEFVCQCGCLESLGYSKRKVLPNGSTEPLRFEDW